MDTHIHIHSTDGCGLVIHIHQGDDAEVVKRIDAVTDRIRGMGVMDLSDPIPPIPPKD